MPGGRFDSSRTRVAPFFDALMGKEERRDRAWYVFEGPSYPDAYLATTDALIVIEGKRTERGPTNSTTWMPIRSQMLRHLDAAFDLAGPRALFGFFMVEGPDDGSLPETWRDAAQETLDPDLVAKSLPHRSKADRRIITEAFLGVTTWQRACRELGISLRELPNEVNP